MENALPRFERFLGVTTLALLTTASPAFAGGSAQTLANQAFVDVSAQVIANCTVSVTAQPPTFQVIPGQPLGEESGLLNVNCTNDTPYSIELGPGSYGLDGTVPQRYMCNSDCNASNASGDGIAYQIFQDSAESTAWGDTAGQNTVNGTGRGMGAGDAIQVPFYVDSPPGQSVGNEVQAGTAYYYSDQVLVTVAY